MQRNQSQVMAYLAVRRLRMLVPPLSRLKVAMLVQPGLLIPQDLGALPGGLSASHWLLARFLAQAPMLAAGCPQQAQRLSAARSAAKAQEWRRCRWDVHVADQHAPECLVTAPVRVHVHS